MARTEASTGNKGGSSKSNIGAAGRKARKTPPKKKGGNAVGVEAATLPPETVAVVDAVMGHLNDDKGVGDVTDTYTFELDYEDQRGYHWQGSFTTHVLTIRERAAVGMTRAKMLGGMQASTLDQQTLNIFEMQAHLAISLQEAPDWAQELPHLRDVGVLVAIYAEVASHEARFWGVESSGSSEADA